MTDIDLKCPNCGAESNKLLGVNYEVYSVNPRTLSRRNSGHRIDVDISTKNEIFRCTVCTYEGAGITFETIFQRETGIRPKFLSLEPIIVGLSGNHPAMVELKAKIKELIGIKSTVTNYFSPGIVRDEDGSLVILTEEHRSEGIELEEEYCYDCDREIPEKSLRHILLYHGRTLMEIGKIYDELPDESGGEVENGD